jgi:hypothetical protein
MSAALPHGRDGRWSVNAVSAAQSQPGTYSQPCYQHSQERLWLQVH